MREGKILGKKIRLSEKEYKILLERFDFSNRKVEKHICRFRCLYGCRRGTSFILIPCPLCQKWKASYCGCRGCSRECPANVNPNDFCGCVKIFENLLPPSGAVFAAFDNEISWDTEDWGKVKSQLKVLIDWLKTFKRVK
jgi:hypothetical protein